MQDVDLFSAAPLPRPPPRPYQEVEWKVHLLGSRRIKVVFDPRSRTETNCDFVTITQEELADSHTQQARRGRSARYHGRLGSENFPGFGGRPPLWLDGDRFVARFKSDPSSTDWGVRFTAYGILDDSDGERNGLPKATRAAVRSVSDALPEGVAVDRTPGSSAIDDERKHAATTSGRAAVLELDLSCWLLELLIHEAWQVPEIAAHFCDTGVIAVLHDCLKAFCQQRQLRVLRLAASVVAEATSPSVLTPELSRRHESPPASSCERKAIKLSGEDVRAFLGTVLALTEAQRVLEGETAVISTYLKALVQCVVILRVFLVNLGEKPADRVAGDESRSPVNGAQAALSSESSKASEITLDGSPGTVAVRDVAVMETMLSDLAQGTTPVRLLFEDFLPILTEACSVTVQSAHPFDRLSTRQSVSVPSAVALQAQFDPRIEVGKDDTITIRGSSQQAGLSTSQGLRTTVGEEDLLCEPGGESSFVGLVGGTSEDTLPPISVGDIVVRGPDWVFGNEDGGEQISTELSGSVHPRKGVVLALEKWAGKDGGARVRWMEEDAQTGFPGSETGNIFEGGNDGGKGFESLYSVQDPAHLRVVKRGGPDRWRRPVVVAGDTLNVEVTPAAGWRSNVSAGHRDGVRTPSDDQTNGQFRGHCFKFDGDSTYVDLPSYGGMRLLGDFTLELWAWLDPGTARNGKPKCMLSRVLDQPRPKPTRLASTEFEVATSLTTPPRVPRASLPSGNLETTPSLPSMANGGASVSDSNSKHSSGMTSTTVVQEEVTVMEPSVASAAKASGETAASSGVHACDDSPTSVRAEVRTVHIHANVEPMPMRVPLGRAQFDSELGGSMMSPREVPRFLSPSGMNRTLGSVQGDVHMDVDAESQEWPASQMSGARENTHFTGTNVENSNRQGSAPRSRRMTRNIGNDDGARRDYEEPCLAEEGDCDDNEEEMEDDVDEDDSDEMSGDKGEEERLNAVRGMGTEIEEGADVASAVGVDREADDTPATMTEAADGSPNPGVVTSDNVYLGLRVIRGPDWTYRQQVRRIVSRLTLAAVHVFQSTRSADKRCRSNFS